MIFSSTICLLLIAIAILPFAIGHTHTHAALQDKITFLPGLAVQPTFEQFAGYLLVNETTNKSLFYWFTESVANPSTAPLLVWTNGGPGCSGIVGFLTEHGPFRVQPDGNLTYFKQAWNTQVNTLYLELPAGVGFSFSDLESDLRTGDAQTARDTFVALEQFYVKFPWLKENKLILSSESYGGHYIPQLALLLLESQLYPNFHGILVGNPLTDPDEMTNWGQGATLCGHSLVSRPTCDVFREHCLGPAGPDSQCDQAQSNVVTEAGAVDPYALDYPTCNKQWERRILQRTIYSTKKHSRGLLSSFKQELNRLNEYDPCTQSEETIYLNRPDVRSAIHTNPAIPSWSACSMTVAYNYSQVDETEPMQPIWLELLAATPKLRLVIYSGDDDSSGPTLGTLHWTYDLFNITQDWSHWTFDSNEYGTQLGGYLVRFNGVDLVTVHSAGHQVPEYKPIQAMAVLQFYLTGNFPEQLQLTESEQHTSQ